MRSSVIVEERLWPGPVSALFPSCVCFDSVVCVTSKNVRPVQNLYYCSSTSRGSKYIQCDNTGRSTVAPRYVMTMH